MHLDATSPLHSSDQPGSRADHTCRFEATCSPIRSCSGRGLPCHCRCRQRGALLPHHFTLASALRRFGGIFSVALSVGSHPPGVTWRPDPWSPDFPLRPKTERLSGLLCVSPLPYVEWYQFAKKSGTPGCAQAFHPFPSMRFNLRFFDR